MSTLQIITHKGPAVETKTPLPRLVFIIALTQGTVWQGQTPFLSQAGAGPTGPGAQFSGADFTVPPTAMSVVKKSQEHRV